MNSTDSPTARLCASPGCPRLSRYVVAGLCEPCYLRAQRAGTIPVDPEHSAAQARAWKGQAIGYVPAHLRIVTRYGPAAGYRCATCPLPAADWSLIPGRGDLCELARHLVYSTDPEDYAPQCASCHRRTDLNAQAWRDNRAADPEALLPGVDWSGLLVSPELPRRLVPLPVDGGSR